MCRPIYKVLTAILKIGFVLSIIGAAIGLFGKGWTIFFIGIGCLIAGSAIASLPNLYLVKHLEEIGGKSLTPKQLTDIVQKHLQETGDNAKDTLDFLRDYEQDISNAAWESKQKKKDI